MKASRIEWQGWTTGAKNAVEWQSWVGQGAERLVVNCCQHDDAQIAVRHAKVVGQDAPTIPVTDNTCDRQYQPLLVIAYTRYVEDCVWSPFLLCSPLFHDGFSCVSVFCCLCPPPLSLSPPPGHKPDSVFSLLYCFPLVLLVCFFIFLFFAPPF